MSVTVTCLPFILTEQQREYEELEAVKRLEMLSLASDDEIDLKVIALGSFALAQAPNTKPLIRKQKLDPRDQERFLHAVAGGQLSAMVPTWTPWYCHGGCWCCHILNRQDIARLSLKPFHGVHQVGKFPWHLHQHRGISWDLRPHRGTRYPNWYTHFADGGWTDAMQSPHRPCASMPQRSRPKP